MCVWDREYLIGWTLDKDVSNIGCAKYTIDVIYDLFDNTWNQEL